MKDRVDSAGNHIEPASDYKLSNRDCAKLAQWENSLLDLSMRNKLLNLNLGSRGGILEISEPGISHIWDVVVANSKVASFPTYTRKDFENDLRNYKSYCTLSEAERSLRGIRHLVKPSPFTLGENELIANLESSEMRKKLKSIRSRAKLFSEERGVDALYLAFGLLEWKDRQEKCHVSPILLAPVSLTLSRASAPYVIQSTGDDVSTNLTLNLLLDKDYDLRLPLYDKGQDLDTYLNSVRNVVKSRNWTVKDISVLGVFSFANINMYFDLKNNGATIMSHPVVRSICGDIDAAKRLSFKQSPRKSMHKTIDLETPSTTMKVLDADSSQGEAIALADAGYSFILQGPPGTGKSQTITNIIASAIGRNKKVLFVSEKRAALDVVKKRLDEAGLGDFTFVLHDTKANKREVLVELCSEMDDVAGIQRSSGVRTFRRYKADAAKLDSYAFDVNKIVEPLSISVWDAYSELVSLASTTALDFPIDSVEKYSQEDLDSQIELIDSYAKSLNELGHDFDKSPWKDAKNAWVTNEYLYRACESAANVATSSYNLSRLQLRANQILGCNLPQTYEYGCRIENLLNSLALCLSSECGVPVDDPHTLLDCVTSLNAFEKANYSRITELSQLVKSATADNNGIGGNTEDFNGIEAVVRSISDIFSCDDNYRNWLSKDINFIIELSKQLSSQLSELRELKTKILQEYISGILDLDARSMLVRFSTKYSKPFGRISKSYREDTSALIALQRNITSEKPSFERQIDLLNSVCRIQELKSDLRGNSNKYEAYFGCLFSGEDTDVGKIQHAVVIFNNLKVIDDKARYLLSIDREAVRSADKISRDIGSRYAKFDTDFENLEFQISNLCKLTDIASSCEIEDVQELAASCDISLVHDVAKKLHDELDAFREACKVLSKYSEQNLFSDDYADIVSRLREQSEDRRELERVLECRHDFAICKEAGLEGFLSAASMAHLEPDELTKGYMRQFYSCWLKAILPGNGSVINFRKNDQESASKDFCDTDKAMIFAARDNVLRSLYSAVSGVVDDIDSKRLHREASKRSHIMPIRKVFDEMPGLVSTLKPCVMMSPLSVSTFLEKRSILFDLVVFDEASQVRTEDAVGAISRGRQVIIAGDSNQLPPTNFFNIGTDDDDIDYEDGGDFDNGDFESVLEEASLLPTINLKWHYRSRNESLITFSNREIYDNSLVTFPSVSEYLPGQGVIFDYVDGGVWGGSQRGNETEAKRVAKLVFLHLEQYPERSLGVIAFGDGQARCIESEINSLRAKYKMFESRFDDKNPGCIFVKSLENVQGDERDSIILSVGYAKDAGSRLRMNFGPLNRRGGERRLNVAITRAKVDLTLVSSILDTDINLSNTSSKGARLLQRYISYARHKKQLHANKTRDQFSSDSHGGIRQFIKYELNARGYIVEFNVGDSSCKIDIAVKSDRDPSVYIAGILTDGPSYASVAYTRERERILPDALKNTGWNLYRAWIPAWAHNPSGELEDLLEFISKCASSFDGRTSDSCTRTRASAHEPEESPKACLNIDETPSINAGGHNIPARLHSEAVSHSVCKATQTMGEPGNRRLPTGQLKTNTNKECSSRKHGHKKHMRDLSSYQLAEGSWDKFGFQEYKAVPEIPSNVSLGEAVLRFIGAEGPTTNDRVLSFIRKRLGGEASLREARIALDRLEDKYTGIGLVVSGDFIRLEGIRDQAPRKGGRLFSEIPPEEIAEGMLRVLRVLSTGGKTTKNDLFDVTYDEFGFSRDDQISPEALRSLNKTYEILRAAGFIVDVGPLHIASREAFEEFE